MSGEGGDVCTWGRVGGGATDGTIFWRFEQISFAKEQRKKVRRLHVHPYTAVPQHPVSGSAHRMMPEGWLSAEA